MPEFNEQSLIKIQRGECPFCGEDGFKKTGTHIVQRHDLKASEVREMFGFNLHTPLCTPELSSSCASAWGARNDMARILEMGKEGSRVSLECRPQKMRPEGRKHQLDWLLSGRHISQALIWMNSPAATQKRKETIKNRSVNK